MTTSSPGIRGLKFTIRVKTKNDVTIASTLSYRLKPIPTEALVCFESEKKVYQVQYYRMTLPDLSDPDATSDPNHCVMYTYITRIIVSYRGVQQTSYCGGCVGAQ